MEVKSNHTQELFLVFPRGMGSSGQCHLLSSSPYPTVLCSIPTGLSGENSWRESQLQVNVPYQTHQSVQFSHSVVSDSLRPHGLQHSRLPCPSPTHGAYSNSCPSSRWCHPTISSSVVPFSCLQSFPASGSFLRSQFFRWPKYWSFSLASVLPMNIQDWFPLGLTGWISLQSKGLSRVFSNTQFKSIRHIITMHICAKKFKI